METDYRLILLQSIGSLTLCEHMGDVSNVIATMLKELNMNDLEWDDLSDLGDRLGEMGITTLLGTSLLPEK